MQEPEPASEERPAGQVVQAVAPKPPLKVPALHRPHVMAPVCADARPTGQSMHPLLPSPRRPAGHTLQPVDPAGENAPLPQGAQVDEALRGAKKPASQGAQAGAPTAPYRPAVHVTQVEAPVRPPVDVPAGQLAQEVEAGVAEKVPAAHTPHSDRLPAPGTALKRPGGQDLQALPSWPAVSW